MYWSFLDAGVIGGCGELCQLLEQAVKVNSSLVEVVCDLLCDYVGIEAFIKLVDKWVSLYMQNHFLFFFFGDIATTYYIADPESNWPCEKLESKGLDWNSTHTATEHISRSSEICIVSFPDLFIHFGAGLGLGQRLRHHREFCLNLVPAVFPHRADLDPIYYCELLHLCPVKDDGDAKITSLTVNPTSVPRGIGHQGYV